MWAAAALAGLAPFAPAAAAGAAKAQSAPEPPQLSAEAMRVADWVASSGDNGTLPYIIIDKQAASLFLFDATPGIGAKKLSEIGPAERTTPAGRFVARFGRAFGKQQVLWVDYSTSVALHPW